MFPSFLSIRISNIFLEFKVYDCASQISKTLLAGPSLINATGNKRVCLPNIHELDNMIDHTGRMMRVLDGAKYAWFSREDTRQLKRHRVRYIYIYTLCCSRLTIKKGQQ
jgi:hypothetical protein